MAVTAPPQQAALDSSDYTTAAAVPVVRFTERDFHQHPAYERPAVLALSREEACEPAKYLNASVDPSGPGSSALDPAGERPPCQPQHYVNLEAERVMFTGLDCVDVLEAAIWRAWRRPLATPWTCAPRTLSESAVLFCAHLGAGVPASSCVPIATTRSLAVTSLQPMLLVSLSSGLNAHVCLIQSKPDADLPDRKALCGFIVMRVCRQGVSEPPPDMPPLLALVMMVKNEADFINQTLTSVKPHIDSWTIADTGVGAPHALLRRRTTFMSSETLLQRSNRHLATELDP